MSNRIYNVLFHTHTISGIIISAVLYVIFFAGSFSFFRDEFINWERNQTVNLNQTQVPINLNTTIDSISKNCKLYGRDITFTWPHAERRINVSLSPTKDSLASDDDKIGAFFYVDTKNYSTHNYEEAYTYGEFLYRLHFLAQIPYPFGYYLSGFVAFFFLFAIFTGILVHWKKIVSNFFVFRPWTKLKTMWTDAHTALGVISFPFQFIYAVTGAFFMIKLVLVAPSVLTLYNGNQNTLYQELGFSNPTYTFTNQPAQLKFNIDSLANKTQNQWKDFKVTKVHISNFNDANMMVDVEGETLPSSKFNGFGKQVYNIQSGTVNTIKNPYHKATYVNAAKNLLYRLHYGDYGGVLLKSISFLLGIIGCFVIISGVLIWGGARDKKSTSPKKRAFNNALTNIYMAVCLSMYPITAATFLAVKFYPEQGKTFIYSFYFIGWLLLSLFYIFKKDYRFTNKNSLLLGSIFGFLIPILNGIATKKWFWVSFKEQAYDIFLVDIFWLLIALTTFYAWYKSKLKS
jgi:uncharacterized iron-regulated membrane protein